MNDRPGTFTDDVPVNPVLQALSGVLVAVIEAETNFPILGRSPAQPQTARYGRIVQNCDACQLYGSGVVPALVCGLQPRRDSSKIKLTEIAVTKQRLCHGAGTCFPKVG